MLRISVKTYGMDLKTLKMNIEKHRSRLEESILSLGKTTHAFMIGFIQSHKVRPSGAKNTLEDAISHEEYATGTNFGFSIGNLNKLNQEAPYWYTINYGGSMFVGKPVYGFFFPGEPRPDPSAFRQGRFYEAEDFGGGFKMTPKKPIPAMSYIENTHHQLRIDLERIIAKIKVGN